VTARRADRLVALALGVLATITLALAARTEGFTRDEGYYFDAAELYSEWYVNLGHNLAVGEPGKSLHAAEVDRWFGYNHEHPALMKTLMGLSWRIFHKCHCPKQGGRHPIYYPARHHTLGLLSESAALRLPAHLAGGLLVALVYLFGAQAFSRRAGLVGAVLALAMPRIFFHAELGCFDAPMATTWLLCIYCWWRSLENRRWAVATGAAFGLALATKHNAFFLPLPMLAHYLWVRRDALRQLRFPPLPAAFVWMALLGPAIEIAHWPWLWFHTGDRLREYLLFHLHHVYYNFEYFGRNYNKPPFPKSFPFVTTLLTAPLTTLVLALLGVAGLIAGPAVERRRLAREEAIAARKRPPPPPPPARVFRPWIVGIAERRTDDSAPSWRTPAAGMPTSPGLLILLNALFPMAVIALTGAPIFGADKHFLPSVPFIALLAGAGLDFLFQLLGASLSLDAAEATVVSALAVALACAPALAETSRSHPYGLSFYNVLAGGPAGGADLGMNRQFWGYATRGVLPWLDARAPHNANVYWHDANQPILNMDVREKLLRDDVMNTGLEEPGVRGSTIAMVIHEKHFDKYEYWIWDFYGTTRPSLVLTDEGVPLVTVYERPVR
jgi:hypothetical protein